MITRTEIGFTDRPRDIQNLAYTILPIQKYHISDLVLFLSQILGRKQKCRIEPIRYQLVALSQVLNDASLPIMSKEPELKTNRHARSTRDQTKQFIRTRFSKGREKRPFQQSTSNRVV